MGYKPEKFEELVLWIAWKMRDDPRFGRVKLAKALFYADFDAFAEYGQAITGATYEHWDHGPVPPVLFDVERKLVRERKAALRGPERHGDVDKLVVFDEPAIRHSEAWELESAVIGARRESEDSTREVSDRSHDHPGWRVTRERQTIPYHAVHISARGPDERDLERAEAVARQHGWT